MDEINTVFILGAGASVDYGLYTGKKLVKRIIQDLLNINTTPLRGLITDSHNAKRIQECAIKLNESNELSIDRFMQYSGKAYQDILKPAITYSLMAQEEETKLFNRDEWYAYFFRRLKTHDSDRLEENKIAFITFNYDRSLEQALFKRICTLYEKTEAECAPMMEKIPIIHVYGQIGYLPWQKKSPVREYTPIISDVETIKSCAACIKTISEVSEPSYKSKIEHLISKAKNICFLGFGYDKTNMDLLGLRNIAKDKGVSGTAVHLGNAEINEIHRYLQVHPLDHDRERFSNKYENIIDFLKDKWDPV